MASPFDVFRKQVTMLRPGEGSYSTVDGMWSDGVSTQSTIRVSVQPITEELMTLVPENRRRDARYALFGDTKLNAANQEANVNADQVVLGDSTYECLGSDHWQNNIVNHYRAVVGVMDMRG